MNAADRRSLGLAAVTVAASMALGRVFTDGGYVLPLTGAAVLPHVVAMLARRRRLPSIVVLGLTAVAAFVYAAWAVVPGTTTIGIPGAGTAAALWHDLEAGWQVFRNGSAPVPVSDGVVVLAMLAAVTVGAAAELLVADAAATVGALMPALVLFVTASSLGTPGARVVTTIAFVVTSALFLMLAQQADLEGRRAWFTGRRLVPAGALAGTGLGLAAAAALAAVVVAPVLPGAHSDGWLDYRSLGGSGAPRSSGLRTLSPLVDLKARLTDQADTELFTVAAPRREYWRVAALDRFDGQMWGIQSRARPAGQVLGDRRRSDTFVQHFEIGPLDAQWLPAAFEPVAIDLNGAQVIPESRTVIASQDRISGLSYRVESRVPPAPSAAAIASTDAPVPPSLRPLLTLPDDLSPRVVALARSIVSRAPTPYDRAVALQAFFTGGRFTYDVDVDFGSSSDALSTFLRVRRGFCEQFAAAYAAMARAVGLPARVAVGFTAGEYDAGAQEFRVRSRDAHAWPEVWLTGMGWTRFEPTPAGDAPGQADPRLGERPTAAAASPDATTATTGDRTATTTAPGTATTQAGAAAGVTTVNGDHATGDVGWRLPLIGALAVAGLAVAGVLTARRRLGQRHERARARRAPPPASVAGAWAGALDLLTRAGVATSPARTPHEQAAAAVAATGGRRADALDAPLRDLAALQTRAVFSLQAPDAEDAERAWADVEALRRALATAGR